MERKNSHYFCADLHCVLIEIFIHILFLYGRANLKKYLLIIMYISDWNNLVRCATDRSQNYIL